MPGSSSLRQGHEVESLLGECLRKLSVNGNLHLMRRELGLSAGALPSAEDLPKLSGLLERPLDHCVKRFAGHHRCPPSRWSLGEMPILGAHLRMSHPQVCLMCLNEFGRCRLLWEVALVTACPVHGVWLTDTCYRCRSAFRWDRPAVGVCRCRYPLVGQSVAASKEALVAAVMLEQMLVGSAIQDVLRDIKLPGFFRYLSVAAACAVLHAFGDLPSAYLRPRSSVTRQSQDCCYWREVVGRAVMRLQSWETGTDVDAFVNGAVLRGCRKIADLSSDRHVLGQLCAPIGAAIRPTEKSAQRGLFE